MSRHPVRFEPSGATAWVDTGKTVLDAAREAGVLIEATCGGRGVCGSCGVRVLSGDLSGPDTEERAGVSRAPAGTRLACRAQVVGPVTVRPLVPARVARATVSASAAGTPLVAGVDLGTTNVSAAVVERTGRQVGEATVRNRQGSYGADVLSRVSAAIGGEAAALMTAARESVVQALELASDERARDIKEIVIACNSAMAALVAGSDPSSLAAAPYSAPFVPDVLVGSFLPGFASEATIRLVPPIASFVGGDVLAGLVALDVVSATRPVLLVDVGTNAEVALWDGAGLTVTSAPAGPAFEGVAGLTGSQLVSVVARLREQGVLGADGLLCADANGVFVGDDGIRSVSAGDPEGDYVVLTQLDIRSLQLAKAAVRVAVEAVLRAADVTPKRLEHVWVAGAFGGALSPSDIVAIGMLPASLLDVLASPGNTSLAGAVAMAMSDVVGAPALLRACVHHVDLASDPDFGARLMQAVELSAATP